jgi:hypothetical protein
MMEREIDRLGVDVDPSVLASGEELLSEIKEAMLVEQIEAEVAEEMTRHENERLGMRLQALELARQSEVHPVHDGRISEIDDLVNMDIVCRKCGVEMAVAVESNVSPLPICLLCRYPEIADQMKE